jgi:hypothetical protein
VAEPLDVEHQAPDDDAGEPDSFHRDENRETVEPDPILHNDRVLLLGKTQSGKSALASHLSKQFSGSRLTIIDPKDEGFGDGLGVEACTEPEQLEAQLQDPVTLYVPSAMTDEEWEEVFDILWWNRGPRVTLIHEAFGPTRAGWAPRGLRFMVQQGAKHDMGLLACGQRPVNIEATLRTEAEHVFLFPPAMTMLDLKNVGPDIGIEPNALRRELDSLRQEQGLFSHLWYCRRTGQLHRCAPLPLELVG